MKHGNRLLAWSLVLAAGWCNLVHGASEAIPPFGEDYQSGELPQDHWIPLPFPPYSFLVQTPWDYTSTGPGRIAIAADTALLATNSIPVGYYIVTDRYQATAAPRTRGNFYTCDQTVVLNKQAMDLGRAASTEITFMVFEGTTSNGTYAAISTNVVPAAIGTNLVYSGEINVPLIAGRYYLMTAGWNTSATYTYLSGSYHPDSVGFGQSFSGYALASYTPSNSIAYSHSSTLYFQRLLYSTNAVVRMDSSVSGSIATNSIDMAVDLSDQSDVSLSFRYRDNNDENDAIDGIFLSDDNGATFSSINTLSNSTASWQTKVLDLDALATSAGMAIGDVTTVRFQQCDNYTWTGGDGREFDDIKLYSKPDFASSSLSASSSFLWKGFTATKSIPAILYYYSRGSNADFSAPSVDFEFGIREKTTDELVYSSSASKAWSIDAMTTRNDSESRTLVLPAALALSNLYYVIYAQADVGDDVDEAIESNNHDTKTVMVNHYSGRLWFNDIETAITISSWGTNVADSATAHWITGTGTLEGKSFSFTGLDVIKNPATLDYRVAPTETTVINVSFPDRYEIANVTYWRDGGVDLSKNGAYADIKVLYPSGLGVSATSREILDSTYTFATTRLAQSLHPAAVLSTSGTFYVVEESKPVGYEATKMTWNPGTGIFSFDRSGIWSVRDSYYDYLESKAGVLIDPKMAEKKSNAAYYRGVAALLADPQVSAGNQGDARLSTEIGLDRTAMIAHFPYGVRQEWGSGSVIVIDQDLIDADASQLKDPAAGIEVPYARDCNSNIACAGSAGMKTIDCSPTSHTTVGTDGGFATPVEVLGNGLQWGTRDDGAFTQKTEPFATGTLYIAGHFIRGDLSNFDASDHRGPAEILLSGMPTKTTEAMERPSKANYSKGFADYAGLNLRVEDNTLLAESIVGGEATGPWQLTDRAKYYVRHSGVTGIHEAVPGTFPLEMRIYDYFFGFDQYGLSYLSGEPEESRISGYVEVPDPCTIKMAFEELMLDCLGELCEAELADTSPQTLAYWDAVIQPLSLFFAPTASSTCGNQARRLCMGLTTQCANVDQALSGILGFMPDGEIGTPADQIDGVPSRLSVPNQIKLEGPGSETYYLNPVAMPYYNNYALSGDTMNQRGWINFAGTLDVAFFEDLQVHFHTSASTNNAAANIYMMGGWNDGGNTFFNSDPDGFDTQNTGYPKDFMPYAAYRTPTDDNYRVHALRNWIGVVDFDYPLDWSSATKSFKSPQELEEDLLVAKVQHQTDYLSAENAEISFGMQYDGMPQINLANMAFNAVDEATGMASAFTDAVGDEIHSVVNAGVGALDDTLSDLPEMLFDPVFDAVLDPLVDEFYAELYTAYTNAPDATDFGSVVTQYVYGVGAPIDQNLTQLLSNLANYSSGSVALLDRIDGNLDQAIGLIDAFASVVTATNGVVLPESIPGLLSQTGGEYETLTDLGVGILSVLAETLYDSISDTVQESLNEALESATPSLEAITQTLLELRVILVDVQEQLDEAGNLAEEIDDTLNSPLLQQPVDAMCNEIMAWFESLPDAGATFDEYTPEEVKAMLRQRITDAFYASVPCANVQQVLRSRLYELEASINQGVDSAFQQLNLAMKGIVSQFLSGIDEEINGALGDLSDVMGSGQIEGYAHIRHDTLSELRLDGKFQWTVPDEMEFNAFLIIKDLNSTAAGGCGLTADSLPEVTLGTTDFGMGMLGSDIRADISVKFAFAENEGDLRLIGLGGAFEMTEGEIGFESFAINEFYAAVAFGALENYLSANVRCEFSSFAVEGGVFLGKTCSLDPFSWDPDVQSVLGDPPFTGVYVYGEGWMPIVDWGCLFRVKAGVGAGIFYFVDGPVGGKIFLGAAGEALCVVSVSGDVTLIGLKDGDNLRMKGKGRISGRVGACPFCVKFKKTVTITYDNGDWDADY